MSAVAVIAVVTVREGLRVTFEHAMLDLSSAVRANEPGNLLHQLTRAPGESGRYKIIEFYKDRRSVDDHIHSPHFRTIWPRIEPCLAGPPDVEFLDIVE